MTAKKLFPRNGPLLPFLVAAFCLAAFWSFGEIGLGGFRLGLGSIGMPTHGYAVFAMLLTLFGAGIGLGLGLGVWRAISQQKWRQGAQPDALSAPRALVLVVVAALVGPLLVQSFILRGAPLTDDEGAYQFSARVLAGFRLWVPSPAMKLFFDNGFLVNDGKMYSQYFLGWPAVLALGELVGAPKLVNPLLAVALALAIFFTARQWWGQRWALVSVVVVACAPITIVASATLMSHTLCAAAYSWALCCAVRAVRAGSKPGLSAALAFAICVCFWCRPSVGLSLAPLVVWWLARLGPRRWSHVAAFGVVTAPLAAAFLFVNHAQTGDAFRPAYNQYVIYTQANDFRFSPWHRIDTNGVANMFFGNVSTMLSNVTTAIIRMNVDLFGWPSSLALAFLSRGSRARLLASLIVSFFVVHLAVSDSGVDSFGPTHYFELVVPVGLLSIGGIRRLSALARTWHVRGVARSTLAGLGAVTVFAFVPVRLMELVRLTDDVLRPYEFVESHLEAGSVVFVTRPIAPPCESYPSRHFVFFRPNNHPDLSDPVLWVNHVSVRRDKELVKSLPNRKGYILITDRQCESRLLDVAEMPDSTVLKNLDMQERPGDF